nr:MAG TPA: hypothetical protein [Caudoviricetes sp.]
MRYIVECELNRFQAWSGGKTWLEELINHPKAYDYIVDLIELKDLCYDGELSTETEINDYLWFYMQQDLREAGFLNENDEWIENTDEEEDEDA